MQAKHTEAINQKEGVPRHSLKKQQCFLVSLNKKGDKMSSIGPEAAPRNNSLQTGKMENENLRIQQTIL